MDIGKVTTKEIDSILYVSSYQKAFNPKCADKLKYVKADDHSQNKLQPLAKDLESLYQKSFGKDKSVLNIEVNKILNADLHSFGKKNILYHEYTPGIH
jgi:hypothetical protein